MKKSFFTPKKIINGALTAIMAGVFIFFVVVLCTVFVSIGSGKTPDVFGYRFYVVASDSMTPNLQVGDILISKKVENLDENSAKDIKVGDIVTYIAPAHAKYPGITITHRVVEEVHYDEIYGYVITTRGDKAGAIDDPPTPINCVTAVGVKKSTVLSAIYSFFTKPTGLIILIAVPLVVLIGGMVYRLVMIIKKPSSAYDKKTAMTEEDIAKKAVEEFKEREKRIETIKQKAIEEYKKEHEE